MLKKLLLLTLAGLLVNMVAFVPVQAASKAEKGARFAEKVKDGIKKLGVGEAARIEVKLKDKTKVKGYVSSIDEDGFSITDAAGTATIIPYPQVKQAKGNNLTTGQKILIGVGIAAAVLVVVVLVGLHSFRRDCCF